MVGTLLTHWTIRLALLCYVAYVTGHLWSQETSHRFAKALRILWTIGCLFFCAHVFCAFAFYHHFSHQEAFDKTATETKAMLGYAFGEGIYFSYLFLVIWIADVIWQWLPRSIARPLPAAWTLTIHAYIFFIALNGALIFEGGVTRWFGIPLTALLLFVAIRRMVRNPSQDVATSSASTLMEAERP